MNNFYFTFGLDGVARLPRRQDVVRNFKEQKRMLALQLDANVCLDIANFVSGRKKQPDHTKLRVRSLLRSIELSRCEVIPSIGLMELGLKRGTFSLDEGRYGSLAKAVWEGLHLNLSAIEVDNYLPTGVPAPPPYNLPIGADVLSLFFEYVYCAFLKLHLLAKLGLSEQVAMHNINEFLRWSNEDLNMVSPFVLQFALGLFGGDTKIRKMLKVDSKSALPLFTAWGAAQDVFSLYVFKEAHLFEAKLLNKILYVTADEALFEVCKRIDFTGVAIRDGCNSIELNSIDCDYPHFKSHAAELSVILEEFQNKRIGSVNMSNLASPRQLILELESSLR